VKRQIVLLTLVMMAAVARAGDPPAEPTLKDLRRPPAEIRQGEKVKPDADRARELYQGFLDLEGGDPELRTEALRRLGDLQLDAGEAARGEAPTPGAGSAETRSAIEIYTRLLEEQPDYPRADAVLYQLARAWEAEGNPAEALAYLDRLTAKFPGSPRITEAQFRRGEILFSAQRWREAESAYAAVIQAGAPSEFYEQALYKQGWTLFKQSDTERSAESFLSLLDRKLADPAAPDGVASLDSLTRADREIVADTFRILSIEFAALDPGASLDAAISRHGKPAYSWMLYAALGDMLVEKERYTDAADTYRAFVKLDPGHRRAPSLQESAINAYLKGGFADLALEGKREFIRQYRFDGVFWSNRGREDAPEVVAALKSNLQDVAKYQHALSQASGKRSDYQETANWYRQYLDAFPDDPDSAATNYLLADALFESQDYTEAAREYERTAYSYPAGEQSARAGYAALVSYDKQEAALSGDALTAWHMAGIESSLRFAATFPAHPEAGKVRLRAAEQLFNQKDYERAAQVALLSAMHQPPLDAAGQRTAWNIAADSAFELGQFAEAEAAYQEVLGRMPPDDAARGTITERLAAAVYKQGEARQQAGDSDGAVRDFLRIGALAPGSPIRATAEYDAAALLIRERQWRRAIPVLEAFRRDYPDNPLAAGVTRSLALAYGESDQPLQAAAEYERIADSADETDEVRRAALVESAGLYEQGSNPRKAAAVWERFVERYPEPLDEAMNVRLKLADMATTAGDPQARELWLRRIIAADASAGAARSDSSRLMAARAALELAGPAALAFRSIRLEAPLARTLKAKRGAMETALKAYQAAADYGVAEVTTAATFETAELYRQLAADLMASERPGNLKDDELEQYDLLLEEQAYPFEERAIALHETNTARTRQGLYDVHVRRSFAALAELKPARYARHEILPVASYSQDRPSGIAEPASGPAPLPATTATAAVPQAASPTAAAEAQLAAARAAVESGNWEQAEQDFSAALEAGGGAPAMTGLGLAYRNTGRFELAEQAYRSALAADPAYAPAMLNLGVLLDLYLQQPAEALAQYEGYQATAAEPDAAVVNWIREVSIRVGQLGGKP
jgi:tetratricopeptide (TPR) repeat protein